MATSQTTTMPGAATSEPSVKWVDPNTWDRVATQYNDAVGRSSRIGAAQLITLAETLHPFTVPRARALDLGAGTGSLTHQLAARNPALPILATDISPAMLDELTAQLQPGLGAATTTGNNSSNVTTRVVDMASPLDRGLAAEDEASFSHVFSTMALQVLRAPDESGVLAEWARLLAPGGVVAIALWDFDSDCGPHAIWAEAAAAVDPTYVNPPMIPEGHWSGCKQLETGLKAAGFQDVKAEVLEMGFDVGKEGFMRFFWESENPMAVDRQSSFNSKGKSDLGEVRRQMGRLLDEKYEGGSRIPLVAALAVGRKPD